MVMTRRWLMGASVIAGIATPYLGAAGGAPTHWHRWVRSYVQSGRVIDKYQNGISHSEGQGYGLLLAQAHGDRKVFDQIERWTLEHLAVRDDQLMAWKWRTGRDDNIADWHNATDGDLFRAWALLRAGRDSGWSAGHIETAVKIAHDIARLCLVPDPRAIDEPLLVPGAEARRDTSRVLINPSYFMLRALRELGHAAGEHKLIQAADHAETVLAELADTGFLPNWIDVTKSGFARPDEHDLRWGYDALRIPLYLVWSGRSDHPAVELAATLLDRGASNGHRVVEATRQGQVLQESDRAGFLAVRTLIDCGAFDVFSGVTGTDYYSETLFMLAELAFREGGCNTDAQ